MRLREFRMQDILTLPPKFLPCDPIMSKGSFLGCSLVIQRDLVRGGGGGAGLRGYTTSTTTTTTTAATPAAAATTMLRLPILPAAHDGVLISCLPSFI